ncbi:hypothetical protein SAMD00019534_020070 [Acytostelium subglobosum LB1]|uniref:hypothetical protein n=1 Tax=Acytostelium subglobosum LB1 TaxID=1410327 RepID=UPI000644C8E0|nr:hypothetical protein SAMD00019534_020070 [Acytostelium subglobosum LB1]GAM18832.1 hypothetical protein SAMD00019534_020070 [Acytostelium subglobosum LB1]|eukprot:XP_012758052.1 hypothetical protein SAMD00019534_020070 [Acytostelium subglobosum LB1]
MAITKHILLVAAVALCCCFSVINAGLWPDETNTGYKKSPGYPGSLVSTCPSTVVSNSVYKYCNYINGLYIGSSSQTVTNITFIGCRFASNAVDDANVAVYGSAITFNYCTFEPKTTVEPTWSNPTARIKRTLSYQYGIDQRAAGPLTVDHCDMWGFANGIQIGYSDLAGPLTIRHSWFHNLRQDGGGVDHTDALLENYGGLSHMVIDHNTITGVGNTNGLGLQGDDAYQYISITNNYFSGYAYMLNLGGHTLSSNMVFTGNVWGAEIKPGWGPVYDSVAFEVPNISTLNNQWQNNTIRVGAATPSTWMATGNNGLYWWPTDINPSTKYVIIGHATDYI